MWPIKDIPVNEAIYRDYLRGISENKFRSARLHTWFDTPDTYFSEELAKFRSKKPLFDPKNVEQTLPAKEPLTHEPIKVFTDDDNVKSSLTDSRFLLVDSIDEAEVFWGLGLERKNLL